MLLSTAKCTLVAQFDLSLCWGAYMEKFLSRWTRSDFVDQATRLWGPKKSIASTATKIDNIICISVAFLG
jgi:hypothetical protein